ncbi:MAG: PKD domain-containing protein [Pirellula sp.]
MRVVQLSVSGSFINIDTLDTHSVTIDWGDGSTDTVVPLSAGVRLFNANHIYRDDNPTGTASDGYTITVTIVDQDNDSGSDDIGITVNNVDPAIDPIMLSQSAIDESQSVTVSGSFTDPALGQLTETFTGTTVWSDGVVTLLTINGTLGTFSTSRLFLDDHPATGTAFDLFTVDITINDDDLGSDVRTSPVLRVNNVAPVITSFVSDATFENKGNEGEPVNVTGAFTDIGTLDTHTVSVDWGDGSAPEMVTLVQGAGFGSVSGSHIYAAGGVYTVTLTVTDDDTGEHQLSTLAVITGIGINNGVLYIVGTNNNSGDHVSVNAVGKDRVRVHADFIPQAFRHTTPDSLVKSSLISAMEMTT